jgi:hypothetical protein
MQASVIFSQKLTRDTVSCTIQKEVHTDYLTLVRYA